MLSSDRCQADKLDSREHEVHGLISYLCKAKELKTFLFLITVIDFISIFCILSFNKICSKFD